MTHPLSDPQTDPQADPQADPKSVPHRLPGIHRFLGRRAQHKRPSLDLPSHTQSARLSPRMSPPPLHRNASSASLRSTLTAPPVPPSTKRRPFSRLRRKTLSMFFQENQAQAQTQTLAAPSPPPVSLRARSLSIQSQHSIHSAATETPVKKKSSVEVRRRRSKTLGSLDQEAKKRNGTNFVSTLNSMLSSNSASNTPSSSSKVSLSSPSFINISDPPNIPPLENETPKQYISRMKSLHFERYINCFLSHKNDDFNQQTMSLYLQEFDFNDEPLDLSLRKFLLISELPKESQQIDRVLEIFSKRYYQCNSNLKIFENYEDCYILTYSLIMLHTDFFNKNNKKKMSKYEFLKNLTGSTNNIENFTLECFYDNITFTPFIHSDDHFIQSVQLHSPNLSLSSSTTSKIVNKKSNTFPSWGNNSNSNLNIDPYYLINEGIIDSVRPTIITNQLNTKNAFKIHYLSVEEFIETRILILQQPFLRLCSMRSRTGSFSIYKSPSQSQQQAFNNNIDEEEDDVNIDLSQPGSVDIKVIKFGKLITNLNVKDLLRNRKQPRSSNTNSNIKNSGAPFKQFDVILTLSNLYFFKDSWWSNQLENLNLNESPSHLHLHSNSYSYSNSNSNTPVQSPSSQESNTFENSFENSTNLVKDATISISIDDFTPLLSITTKKLIALRQQSSSHPQTNEFSENNNNENEKSFYIYNNDGTNQLLISENFNDMILWINAINYISTLNTCNIDLSEEIRSLGFNRSINYLHSQSYSISNGAGGSHSHSRTRSSKSLNLNLNSNSSGSNSNLGSGSGSGSSSRSFEIRRSAEIYRNLESNSYTQSTSNLNSKKESIQSSFITLPDSNITRITDDDTLKTINGTSKLNENETDNIPPPNISIYSKPNDSFLEENDLGLIPIQSPSSIPTPQPTKPSSSTSSIIKKFKSQLKCQNETQIARLNSINKELIILKNEHLAQQKLLQEYFKSVSQLKILTPLQQKTRDSLSIISKTLIFKLKLLWMAISRNESYRLVLNYEKGIIYNDVKEISSTQELNDDEEDEDEDEIRNINDNNNEIGIGKSMRLIKENDSDNDNENDSYSELELTINPTNSNNNFDNNNNNYNDDDNSDDDDFKSADSQPLQTTSPNIYINHNSSNSTNYESEIVIRLP